MLQQQSIIVPQISSYPDPEGRARKVLRWLSQQRIVEPQLSTCVEGGSGMGYALAEGARQILELPAGVTAGQVLPFGRQINGLAVMTKRCIFTPERGFLGEAGCPECRREVGETLFDSLEDWMPAGTDNFTCPECGHEDDINGFLFLQPCGFSNLGFIFNNWDGAYFKADFLAQFAERLGYPVRLVQVKY